MFFQSEDDIAVHTVTAAAYGLLKDIKKSRGMSEANDSYLTGIFYVVRDFHRGILPSHLTDDPIFMDEVRRLGKRLSPITADSELTDVRASIAPDLERQYWNDTNRAANFLKHADRDLEQAISVGTLNNKLLLAKCCCAYQDVALDDLGNEGLVFGAFITAGNESYQLGNSFFGSLVVSLRNVPTEHHPELCHKVILLLNANE